MKKLFLYALLACLSLGCSLSAKAQLAGVPVTVTPSPTIENIPVTSTATPELLVSRFSCVSSVGLWLRGSPEIASNRLLALPQGTKLLVFSGGAWSRVYLKSYDLYGYVKTSYLGDCK